MNVGSHSRTPAIVRIFGTALKAWWDDDALRLGAALAYYTLFAIAPGTACRNWHCESGLQHRHGARRDRQPTRSPCRARGCARRTKSPRWSGSTTSGHRRYRDRRRRVRRRRHRRVPRAPGGAEHGVAGEVESECSPQGIPARSSALLRPGGCDRLSADGVARGDGCSCGIQHMARAPLLERPPGVERSPVYLYRSSGRPRCSPSSIASCLTCISAGVM